MRRSYITSILASIVSIILFCGCQKEAAPVKAAKVEMELNGSIGPSTRAVINPAPGNLPPTQLSIGVVMLSYDSPDPLTVQPNGTDWNGSIHWQRAYFGGAGLGANPVTNGEIKFTNETGIVTQKVFYDETGIYYFLKAVYPYDQADVTQTANGGVIAFTVDGSQDIMCSNLGWGNMTSPLVNTLNFKHLLTKLNLKLIAEAAAAITQYGEVRNIELIDQPNQILYNIANDTLSVASLLTSRYPTVDFPSAPQLLTTAPTDFGYVMALPAEKYTFRIETENRLWFYAEVTFPGGSSPGKAYNVTLKFMQADEVIVYAAEAKEWWLDSTFN